MTVEHPPKTSSVPGMAAQDRFLLWVDGVGGYLVSLRDTVLLGQAHPEMGVDVPIRGDLSRRHALLRRQQEAYWLEALASTRVDGKEVRGRHLLHDGDEIQLGNSVRLRFRQPHALSATARLEWISHHRFATGDQVLLMSESCVLGPGWQNHVVCREWSCDVVLGRQKTGLMCRSLQSFHIDGRPCDGRGDLTFQSRVTGEDFTLTLEPCTR